MAYSAKEKLEKLLAFVTKEEERRVDFSVKAMDNNNTLGMMLHNAEAGMCTRLRYTIEDMLSRNGSNPEWESMEFNEAYALMRAGKKVKRSGWKGYWYWSDKENTIIFHSQNGKEIDILSVDTKAALFDTIASNDWRVAEDE